MPILDTDLKDAKKIFDVNVWGAISTTQVFAPLVIAAKGTIVIIGSCAGLHPYPFGGKLPLSTANWSGVYGASKSAVMFFADTLRFEMYPFNVKVINVCSGGVKTNLPANSKKNYNASFPSESFYSSIGDKAANTLDNRLKTFMDSKEYASCLVRKVDKATKSGWILEGTAATIAWFVKTFLWRTILDSLYLRETGLKELRETVEKGKPE